ncbi:MAG TPA: penicillin-binding protein 1C, partial [Beijerinckiaceae bacterium]
MTRAPTPARRRFAAAFLAVGALGLGVPWTVDAYRRALGPLDLSPATRGSAIAVDREGRLLRAFTTPDGRWRLPATTADVDPRFFDM